MNPAVSRGVREHVAVSWGVRELVAVSRGVREHVVWGGACGCLGEYVSIIRRVKFRAWGCQGV